MGQASTLPIWMSLRRTPYVVLGIPYGVRNTNKGRRITETLPLTIYDLLLIIAMYLLCPLRQDKECRVMEIF